MSKFEVEATRNYYATIKFDVDAENENEAKEKARGIIKNCQVEFDRIDGYDEDDTINVCRVDDGKYPHKVWIRLGGYVHLTNEEFERINEAHGGNELAKILSTTQCERFTPDGDTYAPDEGYCLYDNIGISEEWGCDV